MDFNKEGGFWQNIKGKIMMLNEGQSHSDYIWENQNIFNIKNEENKDILEYDYKPLEEEGIIINYEAYMKGFLAVRWGRGLINIIGSNTNTSAKRFSIAAYNLLKLGVKPDIQVLAILQNQNGSIKEEKVSLKRILSEQKEQEDHSFLIPKQKIL